jgi:hypothetical protein
MQSRRFILQALDPEYGHPAFETMFVVPVWRPRGRLAVGHRSNT